MNTITITKPHTKLIISLIIILFILLLGGLAFSLKLYSDATKKIANLTSPKTAVLPTPSEAEVKALIGKVGSHIILPKGDPKIVTISNVDILKKDQPFFASAQNGQKLLVYPDKVILYDPVMDKVVDIAAIRLNDASSPPSKSPVSPTSPPSPTKNITKYKVLLLNGTKADTISPEILQKLNDRSDIEIIVRTASSRDYRSTIITNISDRAQKVASDLTRSLNATIFPLASSEAITEKDIDFVIIIGSDQTL